MPAFEMSEIRGVIPAMITPFDRDERLDEARLRSCTRFLIRKGIEGLYLTGSTGEGFLMSQEERKRVVEVVIDETGKRLPVIVHVGAIGTKLSVELAEHAQSAGADAVSSVPPFYWAFSQDQIHDFYRDVAGATDLPMIVYNVPMAGVMGFSLIARLATIPRVAGIKYTAQTQFDILRIKQEIGPDFRVYSGSDEMALSGFSYGADGIIGSFYNLMPELFLRIERAVASGDVEGARALQAKANTIIFFSLARNMTAIIKRGMAWQGADAGYCRRPFGNYYDAEQEGVLKAEFRGLRDSNDLSGVDFLEAI
ncbi:MAG: dihydrodipicolinate synthase family protein [Alsobacter sp.]